MFDNQMDSTSIGEEDKLPVPEITSQMIFVKEVDSLWGKMSAKSEENFVNIFRQTFGKLPGEAQKAISLELQAMQIEIGLLDNLDEGVASIREKEIAERIKADLERSGVVASAVEKGLENAKKKLSVPAENAAAYLVEYEAYIQGIESENEEVGQQTEYLMMLIPAIRQELSRLQICNTQNIEGKGELKQEMASVTPIVTSMLNFGQQVETEIGTEALVGFSTLAKLVKEFNDIKAKLIALLTQR